MARARSAAPRITVFVTGRDSTPTFTPTGADCATFPHLLDADNLREAALASSRLENDESGRTPVPLLLIDTTDSSPTDADVPDGRRAVPFPSSPRLLEGLIADAVRVGVAAGAVITVDEEWPLTDRLRNDLAERLRQAGLDVGFDVPGWVLEDTGLARVR
ncbi:MAG: hypothetical protein AAGC80_29540 [Rhodococcus sp. (in: high G+C Gram-positive bacteria)]